MSATHHSIFFKKRWHQKPCNHERWQTSSNILGEQRILSLLLVKINHLGSMTKTPNLPKSCHWQVEKKISTWLIYLSSWTSNRFDALNLYGRLRIQSHDWCWNLCFSGNLMNISWQKPLTKNPMKPTKSPNAKGLLLFRFSLSWELRTTWTMFSEGMSQFNSTMTWWDWKSLIVLSGLKTWEFCWSPKTCFCQKISKEGRSVSLFIKRLGGCMWRKDRCHLFYAAVSSTASWENFHNYKLPKV